MNAKIMGAGIAGAVVIAIAGYFAFSSHQTVQQQTALRGLIADSTGLLREALSKAPTAEGAARLDANLQAIGNSARDRAFADATEHYILGAREIARRRLDANRLLREAAEARQALAAHMARPSVPRERWIHAAGEMKRRVDAVHADLGRVLKALDENLESMGDALKRLEPHGVSASLIDDETIAAARKRAQAEAATAAVDLEKARTLAPR
ncbi:MAG TPA: hypothetical protein VF943_13930 [Burkholderiales bacterium]